MKHKINKLNIMMKIIIKIINLQIVNLQDLMMIILHKKFNKNKVKFYIYIIFIQFNIFIKYLLLIKKKINLNNNLFQ